MSRKYALTRLALQDYRHDWLISLCTIFSLAAALVPLLVLFGIRSGIVGTLTERLLKDPRNLEVIPEGSGSYTVDWIAALRERKDVAFVLPQTRAISATLDIFQQGKQRTEAINLEPSKAGDPLLENWHLALTEPDAIVLSFNAAQKLGVQQAGEVLQGRVSRRVAGRLEQEFMPLTVSGILPLEATHKDTAFVSLSLLEAVEDYRDARAAPSYGWVGEPRPEARGVYPSFRLYAADLDSVESIRDHLAKQGVRAYTRAEEIATVRSLERAFTILGILLFLVIGLGFFASTVSSALAQVNRKQRSLAVLRILGFSGAELALFPMLQSLLSGLLGAGMAFSFYGLAAWVINTLFRGAVAGQGAVCRLKFSEGGIAFGATCLLMVCASLAAAHKVRAIDPAEVIRDV